ncbi:acyl-CoA thioesterase/bile acid-CoA:amino acid N-acyltransferase family protein [Bordetella petrii]|uniref:acyl-CoA thioesterase/bile acid-CoA:amino acid N-acyltransferase family protein n=1 Tax=Bordetella petrii TaxID=94624 RepID=UPI001A95EE00|nr:acyl-CoA thioesterase/bile acid-CoA:amino acid N-acyltransferase family protein [Bordetella petrii]MBO1113246.1 acyl-CoA thioesterase/BAAT N-terminal domain-containing protein [Bordetella petrii]
MSAPDASLQITPADGLLDVPRRIVARGLPPGPAQVAATLRHPDGSRWRSQAEFTVGPDGVLDLDAHAPIGGDWSAADAMAAVWSMRRETPPDAPELGDETAPLEISVEVACGTLRLQGAFVQRYEGAGVRRTELAGEVVGTLYTPATPGPHPAIMVFNGSGGGIPRQRAALYAAHGYLALALGYFKAPGRPDHISDTPLEYFEHALQWLRRVHAPRRGFVAVTGQSRGGELALLLGARFPELVDAVIAYVPSSVVHGTLRAGGPGQPPDAPVWTWRGQPLPNVWQGNPRADWTAFRQAPADGSPVRQEPAFHTPLAHAPSVAAARIPVERIAGPVMLVSGTDDGFWPSTYYAEQVAATLHAHGHAWAVEHVRCQDAGHAIGLPNVPTTLIAKPHPVAGLVLSGGGSAGANARANQASWTAVQRFLREAAA